MALTKSDHIYAAYKSYRIRYRQEGFIETHLKSAVKVAKMYNVGILQVLQIVKSKK